MFNLNLLQKNLTVEEYERLDLRSNIEHRPTYVIARCPICLSKNTEKLDTYTLYSFRGRIDPVSPGFFSIVHHCQHFTVAQTFLKFYDTLPCKHRGYVHQENPYVIGHLLESGRCLAVIHALPVCRVENNEFIPRYTLFMISYFSEQPQAAIRDINLFNEVWYSWEASNTLYLPLQFGDEQWADLNHWVSTGKLFWVDGNDPELRIDTGNTETFPYGNVAGLPVTITRRICIYNRSRSEDLQLRSDLSEDAITVGINDVHTVDLLDELSNIRPKITLTPEYLALSFLGQPDKQKNADGYIEAFEIVNNRNSEVVLGLSPKGRSLKMQKGDVFQIYGHPVDVLGQKEENITMSKDGHIGIAPFTYFFIFQNGKVVMKYPMSV